MPAYVQLPPEFAGLEGKVQFVQRINDNEYHSSCPNCGVNETHSDSNPSDRFVMWVESRSNGRPFGMCIRHCGWKWTPEKHDAEWTPEEKAAFQAKRRELNQREELRLLQYANEVVMKQGIYNRYADNLKRSEYGKRYLYSRGFDSDEWNEFLGFGIDEGFKVRGKFSTYYSPAVSMPIFGLAGVVEQVKMRITDPKNKDDRFRNIYKSGNQHIYFPLRDERIGNKIAIFEGEMKSAQAAMRGRLPSDVQIIATQGKGVGTRMLYKIESAEVVYLCLDPDAYAPNKNGETTVMQTARKIGLEKTRLIVCRDKVDDAIMQGFNLLNAFNMAISPARLR